MPAIAKHVLLDQSERLKGLDEYATLTNLQKQMCYEHVHYPELTKYDIAKKLGVAVSNVYEFFSSKKWEVLNLELCRQQLRELNQLAIKTLRECMLRGTPAVKLEAAGRVLANADLLLPNRVSKFTKQDNKMIVVWGNDPLEPSPGAADAKAAASDHGDSNSLLPARETAGSSRVI